MDDLEIAVTNFLEEVGPVLEDEDYDGLLEKMGEVGLLEWVPDDEDDEEEGE